MNASTAIILAGGFGTRLRTVVNDLPKPMAPVRGKPFLLYQLRQLGRLNLSGVVLSTGHLAEKISSHFGSRFERLAISYSHEDSPLGTGGAVKRALEQCPDGDVLVLNGDSIFDIDLQQFCSLHEQQRAACSIALRRVDDGSRYGTISIDHHNNVTTFSEKPAHREAALINGGIYLLNKKVFMENCPAADTFSIEKDFFEKMTGKISIKGFTFTGYFIDIGVPADFERAQHEFERFED